MQRQLADVVDDLVEGGTAQTEARLFTELTRHEYNEVVTMLVNYPGNEYYACTYTSWLIHRYRVRPFRYLRYLGELCDYHMYGYPALLLEVLSSKVMPEFEEILDLGFEVSRHEHFPFELVVLSRRNDTLTKYIMYRVFNEVLSSTDNDDKAAYVKMWMEAALSLSHGMATSTARILANVVGDYEDLVAILLPDLDDKALVYSLLSVGHLSKLLDSCRAIWNDVTYSECERIVGEYAARRRVKSWL